VSTWKSNEKFEKYLQDHKITKDANIKTLSVLTDTIIRKDINSTQAQQDTHL
jgi:transcriptional regulator of met regulon